MKQTHLLIGLFLGLGWANIHAQTVDLNAPITSQERQIRDAKGETLRKEGLTMYKRAVIAPGETQTLEYDALQEVYYHYDFNAYRPGAQVDAKNISISLSLADGSQASLNPLKNGKYREASTGYRNRTAGKHSLSITNRQTAGDITLIIWERPARAND